MGSSLPPSAMAREDAPQPSGSSLLSPTFSAHPSSQCHNLLCFLPCLGPGNLPKKTDYQNRPGQKVKERHRQAQEGEGGRERDGSFLREMQCRPQGPEAQ